jgi:hypothetical protein
MKLNLIMKNGYRSILLLFIKGVYNYVLIKVNINFIFKKQNMVKTHNYRVLYIIMNLTQLERIKTELKRARYGENKIGGPIRE